MPFIMDSQWLAFILAAALAALSWAMSRRRYRRELIALQRRWAQSQRKIQLGDQQLGQALKQIEKLQRELSETRRAAGVASSQLGSHRARVVRQAPAAADEPAAQPAPSTATPGFADTMPM